MINIISKSTINRFKGNNNNKDNEQKEKQEKNKRKQAKQTNQQLRNKAKTTCLKTMNPMGNQNMLEGRQRRLKTHKHIYAN